MMRRPLGCVFIVVCAFVTSACSTVQPWERGDLARAEMAWDPDPLDTALHNHIHFSKEASSGSASAGGGGCGCN